MRVGKFSVRTLGKAQAERALEGEVKVIADAGDDAILGVHIVGAHAADIVHEAAVAMQHRVTASDLAGTIHSHPTLSEAVMEAALDVHGEAIHAPPKKRLRGCLPLPESEKCSPSFPECRFPDLRKKGRLDREGECLTEYNGLRLTERCCGDALSF